MAVQVLQRHRSVGGAAQEIGLSQPALTQGLNKLEAQLGGRLFERGSAGLVATREGEGLIERAARARRHLRAALGNRARPELAATGAQLRALLGLADNRGFAAAATALGLAEGTLHRAVRALETALGVPLAARCGRSVMLTVQGERLARAARLAFGEIAAAISEFDPAGSRETRLTIGAMPLCRAQLLPLALHAMLARWPSARIRIVEGSWNELVGPLRGGVLDLMIGALREDPAPPDLRQTPLFEDRLVIVAGPEHPLHGVVRPSLEDFAGYDWIVGPAGSPLRQHWERLFAGRALPAAPIECGSVMTTRGLLRANPLLTLLSPAQISVELESGALAVIGDPLPDGVRTIGVAMRADWRPTPVQNALLEALVQASATMRL
ncbi:LysR family transcriptional regulator [Sphingomonas sp. CGMCC 1.13654]|uniref:LysR family transcriptional regulator n=2 Tax=Sphingomonas chungangi TaxID=2683589 RepID=A0A838LBF8_9SPHN|nr:LysR family transcriptional regulator [Sphingomonas chungangi]MBA2936192.1 LysR family transcriptional regulator [Sphingomonas chungangi]MVW55578.1 LysR family transcriptional regulator [Sphingomonas chungangi]